VIKKEAEKVLKSDELTTEIHRMWNVKAQMIPVITGRLEPSHNHSDSTGTTHWESNKLSNYIKQPFWALHTNCGKC
jgi:hypothetical protein